MPNAVDPGGERGLPGSPLILIAEDEPEIVDILSAYLRRDGFRCVHAPDGHRALDLHSNLEPDLVLLDVQMPSLDGWRVLAEMRNRGNTPVIMLTAMDQDLDKLMGLRMGADDYIIKPFNPAEVVARVMAVIRRSTVPVSASRGKSIHVPPLFIDLESYDVFVEVGEQTNRLKLTPTEFKLLVHLAQSPRRVFSRSELLEACLPESDALERTVDSHMSKLRKKIEETGISGTPSVVRGAGYRLWD